MNVKEYAKGVEQLVDPMAVGKTHYLQTKLVKLPTFLQKRIVTNATKKAGMMPFVVEPYCTFMFYEIANPEEIQKYMPKGFYPVQASIFSGDEKKFYGIVSMFRIHTSVFWGARAEYYLVAKNAETGLTSWVMMDYISDTISYDEKNGLKSPDAKGVVMTTTCEGDFLCEMHNTDKKKFVNCEANLKKAKMRKLDPTLWVEGNTSIAYGRLAGEDDGDLFSLTFFPEEMEQALEIPMDDVIVAKAGTPKAKIEAKVERVVTFPYAQHMLSDAPGMRTHYKSETELRSAAQRIDFKKIRTLNK